MFAWDCRVVEGGRRVGRNEGSGALSRLRRRRRVGWRGRRSVGGGSVGVIGRAVRREFGVVAVVGAADVEDTEWDRLVVLVVEGWVGMRLSLGIPVGMNFEAQMACSDPLRKRLADR